MHRSWAPKDQLTKSDRLDARVARRDAGTGAGGSWCSAAAREETGTGGGRPGRVRREADGLVLGGQRQGSERVWRSAFERRTARRRHFPKRGRRTLTRAVLWAEPTATAFDARRPAQVLFHIHMQYVVLFIAEYTARLVSSFRTLPSSAWPVIARTPGDPNNNQLNNADYANHESTTPFQPAASRPRTPRTPDAIHANRIAFPKDPLAAGTSITGTN